MEMPLNHTDNQIAPTEANVVPGDEGSKGHPIPLDKLRELRAEVQDFDALLKDVRKGSVTLKTYAPYIQKTCNDINALIQEIKDGDSIRHIQNLWEQMSICPLMAKPENDYPVEDQLHYIETLGEQIRKMIFLIGMLTIPSRLNEWLAEARPGYYVPFHLVFEDEIPNEEDRMRVLNYLAWSPKVIKDGIVDVTSGLIYRYSRDSRTRFFSILELILGFLAAFLIVILSAYMPFKDWPLSLDNLGVLIGGWMAVLVGIAVHVAVANVKRKQSQPGLPPVIALGDLPFVIDAQLGQLLMKLALALVGFYGLIFTAGIKDVSILNAFLVGYSLDSVVELFGSSIEQKGKAQITDLEQKLGGEA